MAPRTSGSSRWPSPPSCTSPSRCPTSSSTRPAHGSSPAESTSARMGCRAFLKFLGITLGLQPSMRYHGARTHPPAYWSSAGVCSSVPRFAGSAGLVSPPDANHDSRSVFERRSQRQGCRREITNQRSGDRWATLHHQCWVECLTGSKGRHRETKSQGAAKHSSQA